MKLANQNDLCAALDLSTALPQYVNKAAQALEYASLALENDLRTVFDLANITDQFRVAQNNPSQLLKLSQGFVSPAVLMDVGDNEPVEVETDIVGDISFSPAAPLAVTYYPTFGSFEMGQGVDITSICKVDSVKGIIWVGGVPPPVPAETVVGPDTVFFPWLGGLYGIPGYYGLKGSVVSVSYTAGFPPSQADPDQYDPITVPGWLSNLAIMKASMILADDPAMAAAGVAVNTKHLPDVYASSIAKRSRYTPNAVSPYG
jgi:hypothetical protein